MHSHPRTASRRLPAQQSEGRQGQSSRKPSARRKQGSESRRKTLNQQSSLHEREDEVQGIAAAKSISPLAIPLFDSNPALAQRLYGNVIVLSPRLDRSRSPATSDAARPPSIRPVAWKNARLTVNPAAYRAAPGRSPPLAPACRSPPPVCRRECAECAGNAAQSRSNGAPTA